MIFDIGVNEEGEEQQGCGRKQRQHNPVLVIGLGGNGHENHNEVVEVLHIDALAGAEVVEFIVKLAPGGVFSFCHLLASVSGVGAGECGLLEKFFFTLCWQTSFRPVPAPSGRYMSKIGRAHV